MHIDHVMIATIFPVFFLLLLLLLLLLCFRFRTMDEWNEIWKQLLLRYKELKNFEELEEI